MQDTAEVIINEDGKSCTTVNPMGEKPVWNEKWFELGAGEFHDAEILWQQADSERKTYEISNQVMFPEECWDSVGMCLWNPGSIYKAIIINNKAVIL